MEDDKNQFKDGKYLTSKGKYFVLWVFIVIFFLWMFGAFNRVSVPGSFFEKNEYSGYFYAYVFPDKDKVKNYKIPAHIQRIGEDCEYHGSCSYVQYLHEIYFPNGGSVSFSDCHPNLNTKTKCIADDEEETEYYIQLTNEKAPEQGN